jgi:hypothetical protein
MSLYARFMQKWFLKTYVAQGLRRAEKAYRKGLRDAPPGKRSELRAELSQDIDEWREWKTEVEDAELVSKAARMGIYLDEIPLPSSETDGQLYSHYEKGSWGNVYLNHEIRIALRTKVREYRPTFRKERREAIELCIRVAALIITGVTGLLGSATGLIALLKK